MNIYGIWRSHSTPRIVGSIRAGILSSAQTEFSKAG